MANWSQMVPEEYYCLGRSLESRKIYYIKQYEIIDVTPGGECDIEDDGVVTTLLHAQGDSVEGTLLVCGTDSDGF